MDLLAAVPILSLSLSLLLCLRISAITKLLGTTVTWCLLTLPVLLPVLPSVPVRVPQPVVLRVTLPVLLRVMLCVLRRVLLHVLLRVLLPLVSPVTLRLVSHLTLQF